MPVSGPALNSVEAEALVSADAPVDPAQLNFAWRQRGDVYAGTACACCSMQRYLAAQRDD